MTDEKLLTAEEVVAEVWELISGRVRVPPAAVEVVKRYARQQVVIAMRALDSAGPATTSPRTYESAQEET